MAEHDKAQICENGHIISMSRSSFTMDKFCSKCGAKILDACPKCNAPFKGEPKDMQAAYLVKIKPSAYCYECGSMYPWTESKIKAVEEKIKLEMELTDLQQRELIAVLPELVCETSKTEAAVAKVKRIAMFIQTNAAAALIKEIISVCCPVATAALQAFGETFISRG